MHIKSSVSGFFLLLIVFSGSGCVTQIRNLTPVDIRANPSDIYTFSYAAIFPRQGPERLSTEGIIVINGESYQMSPSEIGENVFEYDFRMPPGLTDVKYYYILKYDFHANGRLKTKEFYTDIYRSRLVNRYVVQMLSDRAPVGAKVAVVGQGFSRHDVLVIGSVVVPTEYISPVSINFIVPSLPAGRTYKVALRTGEGDIVFGNFRIDNARLNVLPERLSLAPSESTIMVFSLDFEAPPGGFYIDVTTDVPASIIMPEVVIPAGARTVNVPVRGGEIGSGSLYVEVPGFNAVTIPLSVY